MIELEPKARVAAAILGTDLYSFDVTERHHPVDNGVKGAAPRQIQGTGLARR